MNKTIVTAVINKRSGIMDILRQNMDSSISEQLIRQLDSLENEVVKVVIETLHRKVEIVNDNENFKTELVKQLALLPHVGLIVIETDSKQYRIKDGVKE